MKLGFFALALCLLASCARDTGISRNGIAWHEGDFQSALNEARQKQTLVMVDFYADW